MNNWKVYLLQCLDNSFYTGITKNISKRMKEHSSGKGSKYVLSRGFKRVIAFKEFQSRSEALKAEHFVKGLKKEDKINWFNK